MGKNFSIYHARSSGSFKRARVSPVGAQSTKICSYWLVSYISLIFKSEKRFSKPGKEKFSFRLVIPIPFFPIKSNIVFFTSGKISRFTTSESSSKASKFSEIFVIFEPICILKISPKLCAVSALTNKVFLPIFAEDNACAAATLDLPTPPFPVKIMILAIFFSPL